MPSPPDPSPSEQPPRPVLGRWLEDLEPGTVIDHALTRTITEADNTLFSVLTMNPQPLHLDEAFAATTEFGTRVVNSLFTLSLLVGLTVLETTHGTTVANLGFEEIAFPAPVLPGDTIRARTEVLDRRPSSSRPGQGIVTFEHRAYNQRGELVARCRRAALMRGRPDPA
ncbi:MAG TPA: MaoC family dehydratase [Acidimicrobiales bacterium]